jgi:hypothetical protein
MSDYASQEAGRRDLEGLVRGWSGYLAQQRDLLTRARRMGLLEDIAENAPVDEQWAALKSAFGIST